MNKTNESVGSIVDVPAGVPCWHIHHDTLLEWTTESLTERIAFLFKHKPSYEIPTRLRLLKPVRNDTMIPKGFVEAGKAYAEARKIYDEASKAHSYKLKTYDEALKTYNEALKTLTLKTCDEAKKTHDEALKTCIEALKTYGKSGKIHDEARRVYFKAGRLFFEADGIKSPEIEALHRQECPDCPWNGKTIFPGERSSE